MPEAREGEQNFTYLVGTLEDGRVLLDFRGRPVDHLKLTHQEAEALVDAVLEAMREARKGRIIVTGGDDEHSLLRAVRRALRRG